jgi:CBS domain-containing protein
MNIAEILEAKGHDVATISPEATVATAVRQLARFSVGALVVSSDGQHIEGIISERDVVRHLNDDGVELSLSTVRSIMSTEVKTCSPDDEVELLMATMTDHRIRHIPVVEEGRLIGLVSIGDVVKSRIGELERDRKELVEYINAR